MKRCNKCNVNVKTYRKTCPLCGELLVDDLQTLDITSYPNYKVSAKKNNILYKIFAFITIVGLLTSVVINIYTYSSNNTIWSAYVLISFVYFWIFLDHTISNKYNGANKMVVQTFALSFLAIGIDLVSAFPEFDLSWSIDYIVPFVTILSTSIILFIVLIKKIKYKDYLMHLMVSIFLGFIPFVLYILKIVSEDIYWPSLAASGLSVITILGISIFADKETKLEIKKRFHI